MYSKEELENVIKSSKTKTEALKRFAKKPNGGNFNTLTFYIMKYDIDISHFDNRGSNRFSEKKELVDILTENSNYLSSNHLKNRLYKEGLKERRCELCGQDENWQGKKMSLILDHINGSKFDNRIKNLRIVCPNCNATLDTHCRGDRYKKDTQPNKTKKQNLCSCGVKIKNSSKFCKKCYNISRRLKNRPDVERLINEINELGYSATGRKYGVSDNTIRNWIKNS